MTATLIGRSSGIGFLIGLIVGTFPRGGNPNFLTSDEFTTAATIVIDKILRIFLYISYLILIKFNIPL